MTLGGTIDGCGRLGSGASMRAPKSVSAGSGDSSSIERSTGDDRTNRSITITEATNDTPARCEERDPARGRDRSTIPPRFRESTRSADSSARRRPGVPVPDRPTHGRRFLARPVRRGRGAGWPGRFRGSTTAAEDSPRLPWMRQAVTGPPRASRRRSRSPRAGPARRSETRRVVVDDDAIEGGDQLSS